MVYLVNRNSTLKAKVRKLSFGSAVYLRSLGKVYRKGLREKLSISDWNIVLDSKFKNRSFRKKSMQGLALSTRSNVLSDRVLFLCPMFSALGAIPCGYRDASGL